MSLAFVIVLFTIVFFFDYLPVLKAKDKKTSWVYGVLLVSSFVVLTISALGGPVPSPAGPIKFFITSVLKLE